MTWGFIAGLDTYCLMTIIADLTKLDVLPAVLIDGGNGRRPQFHSVREKLEGPSLLCIIEFNSSEQGGILRGSLYAGKTNDFIPQDSGLPHILQTSCLAR